jgi:hypothetical protein
MLEYRAAGNGFRTVLKQDTEHPERLRIDVGVLLAYPPTTGL